MRTALVIGDYIGEGQSPHNRYFHTIVVGRFEGRNLLRATTVNISCIGLGRLRVYNYILCVAVVVVYICLRVHAV